MRSSLDDRIERALVELERMRFMIYVQNVSFEDVCRQARVIMKICGWEPVVLLVLIITVIICVLIYIISGTLAAFLHNQMSNVLGFHKVILFFGFEHNTSIRFNCVFGS